MKRKVQSVQPTQIRTKIYKKIVKHSFFVLKYKINWWTKSIPTPTEIFSVLLGQYDSADL